MIHHARQIIALAGLLVLGVLIALCLLVASTAWAQAQTPQPVLPGGLATGTPCGSGQSPCFMPSVATQSETCCVAEERSLGV